MKGIGEVGSKGVFVVASVKAVRSLTNLVSLSRKDLTVKASTDTPVNLYMQWAVPFGKWSHPSPIE